MFACTDPRSAAQPLTAILYICGCSCPIISISRLHNSFRMNTCKSVSKQSTLTTFRMNTYEKHRGWGGMVSQTPDEVCPSRGTIGSLGICFFFTLEDCRPSPYSSPFLSYSSTLFCIDQKLNSFVFNRFHTLCPKHPGVGYPPPSQVPHF